MTRTSIAVGPFVKCCDNQRLLLRFVGDYPQIVPRHLLGLRDTKHSQHGRSDVLQRAVRLQGEPPSIAFEPCGRNRVSATTINGTGFVVCAVCGPPVAGSTICSAFPWSAVINHRSAGSYRFVNLAQASIDRLHRINGRLNLARVPHHIGIGKVHDHHVEGTLFVALTTAAAMPAALISGFKS